MTPDEYDAQLLADVAAWLEAGPAVGVPLRTRVALADQLRAGTWRTAKLSRRLRRAVARYRLEHSPGRRTLELTPADETTHHTVDLNELDRT